jgi:hypothetical protein
MKSGFRFLEITKNLVAGAEGDTGANLTDGLIDKANGRFPRTTLIRLGSLQFRSGVL